MSEPVKVKPMFIVKPGTMTPKDIRRAEKFCGIVIVECSEPSEMRFAEPPIDAEIGVQARAAYDLMRAVVQAGPGVWSKETLMSRFLNALMQERKPLPIPRIEKAKVSK